MNVIRKLVKLPIVTKAALLSSLVVIWLQLNRWTLVDIFTPFLEPFFEFGIGIFFLVVTVITFIYLVMNVKQDKRKAVLPISIQLITVVLVVVIPWTSLVVKFDYWWNLKERQAVIQMIESGKLGLKNSITDLATLPSDMTRLSKGGGEIMIEGIGGDLHVLFYTFRGILDNFAGFVYVSSDIPPTNEDFYGDYKEIEKINSNWYYVSSY